METVLVVGATGNIGLSAIQGALRSGRQVLAVVRNQMSAEKLFKYLGSREGTTTAEADVTSDSGIRSVVERVRSGSLPPFQHVFASVGGHYSETPLKELEPDYLRSSIHQDFFSNFLAYRYTIEYLPEQGHPDSTWTLCTGAQGDMGLRAAPAITQGALFTMGNAACHETAGTNIRFNELYTALRVEVDLVAERTGSMKASEFGKVYETILSRKDVKGYRVAVRDRDDFVPLRLQKKGELVLPGQVP